MNQIYINDCIIMNIIKFKKYKNKKTIFYENY